MRMEAARVSGQQLMILKRIADGGEAVKVLAAPSMRTLEGRQATLRIGGAVPLLRIESTVNGQKSDAIDYGEFNNLVSVTPTLIAADRLKLEVTVESSQVSSEEDLPRLKTRRLEAVVETRSGQTAALVERPVPQASDGDTGRAVLLVAITPTLLEVRTEPRRPAVPLASADEQEFLDKLASLLEHYGPAHPHVVQLRNRLEQAQQWQDKAHAELSLLVKKLFPGAEIEMYAVGGGVLLRGSVRGAEDAADISEIAEQFFPKVLNQLALAKQPDQLAAKDDAPDSLRDRIRGLHQEVRMLRSDVRDLIRLIEQQSDDAAALPERPREGDETSVPPLQTPGQDGIQLAWSMLGLRLEAVESGTLKSRHSRFRGGMTVNGLLQNGPAARAGLRQGDILVGLGKWETMTGDNVAYVLRRPELRGAPEVKFYLLRGEDILTGTLQLIDDEAQTERSAGQAVISQERQLRDPWELSLHDALLIALQNHPSVSVSSTLSDDTTNLELTDESARSAVLESLGEVEAAYWDLWLAHRQVESTESQRAFAQKIWQQSFSKSATAAEAGQEESQARTQYFRVRAMLEDALGELYKNEERLRGLLRVARSDGRLIHPSDDPSSGVPC